KYLLVKAFEDILPKEIVTRKKQGFTFPFDIWMRNMGGGIFEDTVSNGNLNKVYAKRAWDKFKKGNLHWSRVWGLVVTEKRNTSPGKGRHQTSVDLKTLQAPRCAGKQAKVLFLVPDMFSNKGGIQAFNNYLAKALFELGHALNVISINDVEPPGNIKYPFNCCSRSRYLRKPLFVTAVFREIINFKPDIILCGHINFSLLCMALNKIFKIPYLTITHGIEAWNMNGLKSLACRHSRGILSVSRFTRGEILRQLPDYAKENVYILPNTFDPARFRPKPKPQYLMDRWKIKNDDKALLTIARLSKSEQYKGYDKVILAMKDVIKKIPKTKYIIGGSGDDIERIKKLIKENALEDNVVLSGFIPEEEIVDYYNLCDIFVMPSKKEGFGIVFLEALACGKPVIAGNKDGSVDAVLDGEIGVLVDPGDEKGLAENIVRVLTGEVKKEFYDPEYLRSKVVENFGFPVFRKKLSEILETR
ncbi:MAG: glycosyltransferase, partial [Nitrospirae bacterium]|nr:glycosyltransferase [Nitrospirota bacterium]